MQWWANRPASFEATSDLSGLAVIVNLPSETQQFTVKHPRFILPAADTGSGSKRREARITLESGQTNRMTVRLEPKGKAPIAHY